MATKKALSSIDIEDVSQLTILAYQVRTRPNSIDVRKFLNRLKSEHAKSIARVIAGEEEEAPSKTLAQANRYIRWADTTARTAEEASRRPNREINGSSRLK